MLTPAELDFVKRHAYLPEHLIAYVTAISGAESFLSDNFVWYLRGKTLIFVGYPLQGDITSENLARALEDAIRRTTPETVSLISPLDVSPAEGYDKQCSDTYYRLSLPVPRLNSKLANILRRAEQEVRVEAGRSVSDEHIAVLRDFLAGRDLDPHTQQILSAVPQYVNASDSAIVFTARAGESRVIGFSVADYWAESCAFYMFNITTKHNRVPGTSDLLLQAIIGQAASHGKTWVNLGLGVNEGITFFKKKWGAEAAYSYNYFLKRPTKGKGLGASMRSLLWGRCT